MLKIAIFSEKFIVFVGISSFIGRFQNTFMINYYSLALDAHLKSYDNYSHFNRQQTSLNKGKSPFSRFCN